ncbi:MAG: penicillin-binding transpeptidase domain-containing protein [Anaerolineae bacterium]
MIPSMTRLMRALLIGFAAVALALSYWQVIRAPQLVARADNPRRILAERQVQRGRLLDREGMVLAYSTPEHYPGNRVVFRRHYPESAVAHLVGYYSLRYGTGGCEAVFDTVLRGKRTLLQELLHRPQPGEDVTLSANLAAMRAADAALDGQIGALVALDITHGEILAMVSHPSYDPNQLDAEWEDLVTDPAAPLLNRATQGIYSVGDLARWVGLAGLLSAGITTPPDPRGAPLEMLLAPLSRTGYLATAHQLGFTRTPPIALPANAGRLPDFDNKATERDLAVTPLHMALFAAAAARDGQIPMPQLEHLPSPATLERVFSEQVARALRAITPTYDEIAGWVGVALPMETGHNPLTWFVGYAPAEHPEVAIAVVIENKEERQAALSVARRTLATLMP